MDSASSSNPALPPPPPPLLLPPPESSSAPAPPQAGPRPRPTVADGVRGLLRSGEALLRAVFRGNPGYPPPPLQHQQHHLPHQPQHQHQHRAGDLMKRLQRETFSDVMKLKEKHDQIEHIISLYKTGKGLEFLGLPIRMKIALDAVGALFLVDGGGEFERAKETLSQAGKRTGLGARFVLESKTRGKDTIAAELSTLLGVGAAAGGAHHGEAAGKPVELTRLQYNARITKCLSMILVPFGAQCSNFLHGSSVIQDLQSQATFDRPPSFSERHNCAAGVRIKAGPRFTASLAELVSGSGAPDGNRMTTFGQVTFEPAKEVKLSVSGLWQVRSSSARFSDLGILAVPLGALQPGGPAAAALMAAEAHSESSVMVHDAAGYHRAIESRSTEAEPGASSLPQSVAVMAGCELYETLRTDGWFQVERSSGGHDDGAPVRWGLSLSDVPEHELGWGVRVGGAAAEGERGRSSRRRRVQRLDLEGYLSFNIGKGGRLQPGLVYAKVGDKMAPALFLRSSWSM